MDKQLCEIRFHGRGGQGSKTAGTLLAGAALKQGKFVQSFPEYGAEREGAPVLGFTRISNQEIRIHEGIKEPDIVVVIDPTLLDEPFITNGLKPQGILIANTPLAPEELKQQKGFGGKVVTVDATKIAVEELGRPVTNSAMLGALEKAKQVVDYETLKKELEEKFMLKFGEDLTKKNLKSFERAYHEAREA